MKSLLKHSSFIALACTTLFLTACSSTPNFDVTLENADEIIIEADNIEISRQELFETVAVDSFSPALFEVIDWVDYIVLSERFDVDEEDIQEQIEGFTSDMTETEIEEFLLSQGFSSLDQIAVIFRLDQLRHEAILDAVEITEEEIEEAYNEWFATPTTPEEETTVPTVAETIPDSDDEDEVDNEEVDDETDQEEIEEPDVPDLEEVRDDIEAYLTNMMMEDPEFRQLTLANLRAEAGLTFFSNYFETRYMEHLDRFDISNSDLTSGDTADVNDFDEGAIVAVNDVALTADELFDRVVYRNVLVPGWDGSTPLLIDIDFQLLNEAFDGDREQVRSTINQQKINLLEQFYPMMAAQGLNNDQEIFDHFMRLHLQELAFQDAFGDIDEEALQELYDQYMPPREVRHILMSEDDHETVVELIEQLQDADEDELEALFSELALEYSTCPSSDNGGSLGVLSIPSGMVIEFEEAAFALEVGSFSDAPVETEFGYHIIFVPSEEAALSGDRLRSHLRQQYLAQLRQNPANLMSVLIDLRAENNLTFHDEWLQAQYDLLVEENNEHLED